MKALTMCRKRSIHVIFLGEIRLNLQMLKSSFTREIHSCHIAHYVMCLAPCGTDWQGWYSGDILWDKVELSQYIPRQGVWALNQSDTRCEMAYYRSWLDGRSSDIHSFNHFLITSFSWIELVYTCTLMNHYRNLDDELRPLKEGKWYPTIAIGLNDPIRHINDHTDDYKYFMNFYIVASKHFLIRGNELGVHLAYRYYPSKYNRK